MNCSQCGYANRVAAGQCARCGAPLGVAPTASPQWVEDDRTVVRSTQRLGPEPAPAPAVWPTFEAGQAVPGPVPVPRDPAPTEVPAPLLGAMVGGGVQRPMATIGSRLAAHLLDGLVITGVLLVLYVLSLILEFLASAVSRISYDLASLASALVALLMLAAYAVVAVGYVIWGWGNGQTIGKRVMKIAVVDARSGAPIGYSRAVIRYLMMVVMGLPCYAGYFSILATDGRGWHDKAADSRVVICPDWPAPVLFPKR